MADPYANPRDEFDDPWEWVKCQRSPVMWCPGIDHPECDPNLLPDPACDCGVPVGALHSPTCARLILWSEIARYEGNLARRAREHST